ncbi:terpene cyclase [Streptomyces sp. HC44]|uniref:Terpene synthase n=1 Tax=Streptomyces scabichelini TaxID=2711217 RepID=A0A6G4UX81_9ACTN|nr:terpene cyclase [Streptomyces scabichelini]NGO06297.1 terpene cyclase [Streptomyces scabichelini]
MDTDEPDIRSPFPHRLNPFAEKARFHVAHWVRHNGLVHRESARERFERADFGWFAAVVYPTADASRLNLMADWFAWLFLVDDQLDDGRFGRSPDHVGETVDRMRAVLGGHGRCEVADPHIPTTISSLAGLWERTAPHATPEWRRRFVGHLEECLRTAAVWEAGNRIDGTVPSEETYIVNRRHTGAIYVCMDLIEIVERISVPDSVHRSPEFTAALDAACNVVCWTNDVHSLAKERLRGEVHNLVFLVEHHRGLDRRTALDHVRTAIEEETGRYLAAEAKLLTAHPDRTRELTLYTAGMRTWMRGNLDWSRRTKRYHPASDGGAERPEDYLETRLMEADR